MSGTPITDKVQKACRDLGFGSIVVVPDGYPPHDPWELARSLEKENNEIICHNRALIEALEAVEWSGHDVVYKCPSCQRKKSDGHNTDCDLGNALKRAR